MWPRALIQDGFSRRFEWGVEGARCLARSVDVLVVVDVLSFSTAVDVAVARGAAVVPVPWHDRRAVARARELGALLAVGRSEMSAAHPYSLSPSSLQGLPQGARLALPSPNGASISAEAAGSGVVVFAACLRNARAVARAAAGHGGSVGVVAAGERWPDGSLRPALEDLIGAGAVLRALGGAPSPEAQAAMLAAQVDDDALRECASARELVARGFAADVAIAAERDVSSAAPLLRDGAFGAA